MRIEVREPPEGAVNRYGKRMRVYVARVRGPDERWVIERSFTRVKVEDGAVTLPSRDGVYEVRDYPERVDRFDITIGEPALNVRDRYYQVMDGAVVELSDLCPSLDDVLDAVDAATEGRWYIQGALAPVQEGDGPAPTVADALEALDLCVQRLRSGECDAEDACMELDRVRRVLESMKGWPPG
jgi:hypothetical protein